MDGKEFPNGNIHNGCLRVDDTGWSFGDNQIDFFIALKSYWEEIIEKYPEFDSPVEIRVGYLF